LAFTGNASYVDFAAVAIEQTVTRDWSMVWTEGHPILTVIHDGQLNFNRGFSISGTAMLLPVLGDDQDTPVAGIATGSGETVAMAYNTSDPLSQFKFNFAHYRGNYTIRESEAKMAMNGARGNLLEAKKVNLLGSWRNTLSGHLSSTTADQADNSRVLGLYQVLSTSNTVGGISQATDTQIAAYVKTSAGPFALELIEDAVDQISVNKNEQRNKEPDLVLASISSTNNVYGKYRSAIAPAERYVNKDFSVKYGLKNFMHMGLMVVKENRIGDTLSGSCAILSSKTWYAYIDRKPTMHPKQRIPGTDAYEVVATAWACLGCNDPGLNGLVRDIT
jgi:hypothetical protein